MTAFKMSQICTENVCYINRFFCSKCYDIKRVLRILYFIVVVVPFIFRILVHYETFFTRAQGPVIVIAKEEI